MGWLTVSPASTATDRRDTDDDGRDDDPLMTERSYTTFPVAPPPERGRR